MKESLLVVWRKGNKELKSMGLPCKDSRHDTCMYSCIFLKPHYNNSIGFLNNKVHTHKDGENGSGDNISKICKLEKKRASNKEFRRLEKIDF